jgi:hypothetical protein
MLLKQQTALMYGTCNNGKKYIQKHVFNSVNEIFQVMF